MVKAARLQIFRNVRIDQPQLTPARVGIGFGNGGFASPQGFHLTAGKDDASLEGIADFVVEASPAVIGDHFEAALCFCGHGTALVQRDLSWSRISVRSCSVFDSGGAFSSSFF